MKTITDSKQALLTQLEEVVRDATVYFVTVPDNQFDGHLTARQALSRLVFWHREYAAIAQALADGLQPVLRHGTYADLNEQADEEFAEVNMFVLCDMLQSYQDQFTKGLVSITDWSQPMPIKRGGRRSSVRRQLQRIEANIRTHVKKLKRAERHGQRWVDAYYGGIA